jgi:hypothetical protein
MKINLEKWFGKAAAEKRFMCLFCWVNRRVDPEVAVYQRETPVGRQYLCMKCWVIGIRGHEDMGEWVLIRRW